MTLDRLAFPLMGSIIILLITASVLEPFIGTEAVIKYVYTAPWTIVIWAITVVCAIWHLIKRKAWRMPFTFMLHFAFVVILGGALVTHLFGRQGQLHLRLDDSTATLIPNSNYQIRLTDFYLEYYPGTNAPMDFVSEIMIYPQAGQQSLTNLQPLACGSVSMNNIFTYRGYRFYQSMYDSDRRGTTLSFSRDPWGIGITYTGYAMLLISMIGFFFQRRTYFRHLLRGTALVAAIIMCQPILADNNTPPTVNSRTAAEFGNLYVYYNNRVCPMQTLARDFTIKLYGKPTYKGLSSEEVLCGWLFYYDQWADEPCIKIKGKDTRHLLGIEGKYACLNDFVGNGKYKLEESIRQRDKNAVAADEKFQLVSMVCTARLLKIYPISQTSSDNPVPTDLAVGNPPQLTWYSWSDQLPPTISPSDWQYVYRSMDYVFLCIARNANAEAQDALRKIRTWQEQHAGTDNLPSPTRFRAEKIFNTFNYTRPLAMACATIGLLSFILFIILGRNDRTISQRNSHAINPQNGHVISHIWLIILRVLLLCAFAILTFALTLRWIISGHVPLSNGHETMQFLAWVSMLITLIASHTTNAKFSNPDLTLSFGWLVAGMTLMVSMMSASNPQITNLMPVLQSPLLTIHVAVIMIAYCLLAFIMLNGIVGIITDRHQPPSAQPTPTMRLSLLLLYPAVFCLTVGIFIGAVWANISWGRYWGWDPKEVWALITMLVYAFPLHSQSLTRFRKPLFFHIYMVAAFLSVLFTYFGVNFILGGMHSYA